MGMIEGQDEPRCFECGYSLRGLESGRCPECGRAVDAPPIPIPWKLRGQIGWVQAYWKTAWAMTFGWKWIWRDYENPPDVRGARLFAGLTAVWAWLPAATWLTLRACVENRDVAIYQYIGVIFGLLCFVWFATGAAAMLCWWGRGTVALRGRRMALSLYACGPLAFVAALEWLWILILIGELRNPLFAIQRYSSVFFDGFLLLSGLAALSLIGRWYASSLIAIALGHQRRGTVMAVTGILLPLLWALLAVLYIGLMSLVLLVLINLLWG